jgi:ribosome-associated translation inhibitor RaiA
MGVKGMKKYINGRYVEMTPEECKQIADRMPEIAEPIQDTVEERLKKMEQFFDKIRTRLNIQ